MSSLFSSVTAAPADPILGLTEKYKADTRPDKANLGVGVYLDENGKLPLLACVAEAEQRLAHALEPRPYLPIDGLPAYNTAVKELVFGAGSPTVARVATVQALGGTGALRVGAEFLKTLDPAATVLISEPSWENHRALFTAAGYRVASYRYYDAATRSVDVDGMLADLSAAAPGTIVVLHACCHNPTGYDLEPDQWARVQDVVTERGLVPFIDMAYQGFSTGLEEDARVVRRFAEAGLPVLCSTSFSKSFALYGERDGALSVVCASPGEAARVLSRLKPVVRTLYSNPPTHGARLVATVLTDPLLRAGWEVELGAMRDRIKQMRAALVDGLHEAGITDDVSFITTQVGMFSYSGLSVDQMVRLRDEFGVYGTDRGRICVAALNPGNLEWVARSLARVW